MKKLIKISEVISPDEKSSFGIHQNLLKITNVSSQYLNDLKLIINPDDACILEQYVKRERGAASFDPKITCLELGNLAPDESAYFEYKFTSKHPTTSLAPNFSLIFTEERQNAAIEKKIAELLSDSAICDEDSD